MPLDYPGDLLGFADGLTAAERAKLLELRTHLREHVRPLLVDAWERGDCPAGIRGPLAQLRLEDDPVLLGDDGAPSALYQGFKTVELSRLDLGVSIIYGGQVGMFRTLVREGGSPEQVVAWDADILSFRKTGCFALNEPDHGSDIAGGLATTARREGDDWVLDGRKRWIGNATISDELCVIAREEGGGRVLAFLVPSSAPGVTRSVIEHKGALRHVHNADIELVGVRVGEHARLPRIESFRDINRAFRVLRPAIAWNSVGMQLGAYDAAVAYALRREQFGAPIAGYQLIQEKLVQIVANIAQTLALAVRTTTHPLADDVTPSLIKLVAADRLRESAALAREILGGNGLLLENDVVRFLADAEAMYTFEGTREMNVLILGRALTGLSAFTRG
ncbi:acyl-CoA dehydrogenase family protein [Microbacterium sp. SORGH_AS_0888]|uniref:acyl-CoA dehydrogenase family protein n=1 Tax=Microbacterium sp. SORGH_AS_0888 TaxID=3041791 RepID=UPI00278544CF|nr:acyl-CoA dehydrogenase family protein [Microbacterium sp. SORGH_AS_0888]MDQ1129694.1 glutaryl-CoA dehydrogenase [Microbacterium sp. SORGH_AS_0888]